MEFPEDIGELSVDELKELHTKLDEEFKSAPISRDTDVLAAAEELVKQRNAVGEELNTRERLAELTRQQEELTSEESTTEEAPQEEMASEEETEEDSESTEELSNEVAEEETVEAELTAEESTEELTSEEVVTETEEEAEVEEPTEELTSETEEAEEDLSLEEEASAPEEESTEETQEELSAEDTEELSVEDEVVSETEANEEETTTEETTTEPDDSEENMSTENKESADLEQHRGEANAPKFNTASGTGIQAVQNGNGMTVGDEFATIGDFAQALHSRISDFRGHSGNGRDQVSVGRVSNNLSEQYTDLIVQPGTDPFSNFGRLRQAVDMQSASGEALVASGGICAPFDCNYDFFRTCVAKSPIEDAMPVIPAARGGIRYFKPFKPDASGAIGTITCAEDAAGYESTPEWCGGPGPTPDKPCICVECPEIDECCVTAVSTCVRWGNLQWRTFPEHVEEFMHYVNVAFASEKETLYLDAIHAASTPVDGIDTTYGAFRQAFYNIKLAAEAYRCRNCMPENAPLQALVPKWLMAAIEVDRALSCCEGGGSIGQIFAECGISIVEYADSATGEDQQPLNIPQAAGALNPWPLEATIYLFSPGSFVRLDGGQMDLGVVRDHILNRTNDFELFSEQWTGLCFIGCESVCLTIPLCVNGAVPDAVPALAC